MIFHKSKVDETVKEYKSVFEKYVNNLSNQNELYKAFTEITILRLQLDKNDSILKNIKDKNERANIFDTKKLILLQFNDIMTTCIDYKKSDYQLVDAVMKKYCRKKSKADGINFGMIFAQY